MLLIAGTEKALALKCDLACRNGREVLQFARHMSQLTHGIGHPRLISYGHLGCSIIQLHGGAEVLWSVSNA